MPRWEENGRGRLEEAALSLFEERGYDRTTVVEITRRAGLTERSFYRHFADKREVLFGGEDLESRLVAAIDAAPADLGPLAVLVAALAGAEDEFRSREFLRRRAVVVAANPPLQERETLKLSSLAAALSGALERRGVDPESARLTTAVASALMRTASEKWLAGGSYAEHLEAAAERLAVITAGLGTAPVTP